MATRKKRTNESASKSMMSSSTVNSNVIQSVHQQTDFGENDLGEAIKLDLKSLTDAMATVSGQVKAGNLSSLEDMLVCQTYSLQHLFMTMAIKINGTTNADHIELLSKLALKAQNQCRTTIATLSEMKNPKRAMFVKQLNQANQMQVNNSKDSDSEIQKKTSNPANELLEQTDGERLDTRTTGETIGDDDAVKAVAEINRA
ncbi:MAG: hypothetical protein HN791_12655 [Gammaproteobacteria bacterium]|jgi:hypothetical protein|nr:hypothetical protein [Gammaproteobacteria bacterium]